MTSRPIAWLACLAIGLANASQATTVTFSAATIPFTTYTEAGITVAPEVGYWFVYAGSIQTYASGSISVTAGGNPFTFQSIDLYSSVSSIPYSFIGQLNGRRVFYTAATEPNTFGNFATVANPYQLAVIDTLQVGLHNNYEGINPVGVDNIVLGSAVGDPHFTTFAGTHYDYQGLGVFTLAQSLRAGSQFDVQIRTRAPPGTPDVTIISATAATLCGHRLSFDLDQGGALRLDGMSQSLTPGSLALMAGGCALRELTADHLQAIWNTGEVLDIVNHGWYLDVSTAPTALDLASPMAGLLSSAIDPGQWQLGVADSLFAPLPEPASMALLAAGLLGLGLIRRGSR